MSLCLVSRLLLLVCLFVPAAASAPHAAAQPAVSTLSGRVSDPQDSAVAGAAISVRQVDTGATWTLRSGDDGRFTVPMLPPGTFEIDVAADGFAPWSARAVPLRVGQTQQLDVRLVLGSLRDIVTVQADETPNATPVMDDVLTASRIETLPLNGRNFLELALLVPGNQPAPTFDPTKTNSVLVSSAGQLGRGGTITIDGQDNSDDVVGGPLLNLPIDAVQEFQIATDRFGADLGRSASSVINIVTRSGGNAYRGTAALFARDGAWQAQPATADRSAGTSPFDRQQVSAAAGGPLRRDRLFWFSAAEYRNQDGAVLVGTRDVAARVIRRGFAPAPLDDALWLLRVDSGGAVSRVAVRYAGEQANDTAASAVERSIGSATQRQESTNGYHSLLGSWTFAPSGTLTNALNVSLSRFHNDTVPVAVAPQLTFPSLQDGASFRMPQDTTQTRLQIADTVSLVRGAHTLRAGGELQRVDAAFGLGVFRQGRIELVQDFASFDHNGDGQVDDGDLLFAVTLRSGHPERALEIPDADNTHIALFVQDEWRLSDRLRLDAGVRYELDTDVNNQSRAGELNPLVRPFVNGARRRDTNNISPRLGLVWSTADGHTVLRGGYGIYYDRIVLQMQSLERGLDGRALPIEVRAGSALFVDEATGRFLPGAPTFAHPFTGFILPGAGASGITILDSRLQHPMVQELHAGIERAIGRGLRVRMDLLHTLGTHFLIGRTVGEVFNPVVGGPDRVVNIESSARTHYDALLLAVDARLPRGGRLRGSYTLGKAFNYANDDQVPFLNGPLDPSDLRREYGPTPNDRRHRLVTSVTMPLPGAVDLSAIWTMSSGVPMDIMLPDGSARLPAQRNAGGRLFKTARELNAYLDALDATAGGGPALPRVREDARFSDGFNALDLRVSRPFRVGTRLRIEPMLELFNAFNVTNVLGVSNVNYSGYSNVLARDSDEPGTPGYETASRFGRPVTTAGGLFGSGGPRALQIAARLSF